jgi:hypothetical protein
VEVATMAAQRKPRPVKRQKKQAPELDPVSEASDESFPASDAPAWPSGEPAEGGVKRKRKKSGSA